MLGGILAVSCCFPPGTRKSDGDSFCGVLRKGEWLHKISRRMGANDVESMTCLHITRSSEYSPVRKIASYVFVPQSHGLEFSQQELVCHPSVQSQRLVSLPHMYFQRMSLMTYSDILIFLFRENLNSYLSETRKSMKRITVDRSSWKDNIGKYLRWCEFFFNPCRFFIVLIL